MTSDVLLEFTQLSTAEDMDQLCEHYEGFSRFSALMEHLAVGIGIGSIAVPKSG